MAPKFLEDKLKKEYGKKSDVPYKIMNDMGVMKGNKETAKGRAMEKKHSMSRRMRVGNDMIPGRHGKQMIGNDMRNK